MRRPAFMRREVSWQRSAAPCNSPLKTAPRCLQAGCWRPGRSRSLSRRPPRFRCTEIPAPQDGPLSRFPAFWRVQAISPPRGWPYGHDDFHEPAGVRPAVRGRRKAVASGPRAPEAEAARSWPLGDRAAAWSVGRSSQAETSRKPAAAVCVVASVSAAGLLDRIWAVILSLSHELVEGAARHRSGDDVH